VLNLISDRIISNENNMSQIFYRAWDKEIKSFIPIEDMLEDLTEENLREFGTEFIFSGDPNGFILLDRIRNNSVELIPGIELNGRKFFVGDILEINTDKGKFVKELKFEHGIFGVEPMYKCDWLWFEYMWGIVPIFAPKTLDLNGIVILGNKFENPELKIE